MPMLLSEAEGNTEHGVIRQSCSDPARSETLCTSGSPSHRNWEISAVPGAQAPGGAGKAKSRNPAAHAAEKSDTSVVPEKPSNKGPGPAEIVEERDVAKGNTDRPPAPRTQSRISCASMVLEGVREAARRNKGMQFTALLHHITPQLLAQSFYTLRRDAAVGVDGMSWREYEEGLLQRLSTLHARLHSGAYRATPSRRVYIPKTDGRQRPLGVASLEDKIVQQAVVTVLNAIYEEDFLGFSYGFRPGRSQHDALDALTVALKSQKVNWILDADITSFFDEIDHEWMLMFLGHRVCRPAHARAYLQMAPSGRDGERP
ncbi:DNA polymerase [Pseudomonas sp. TCU-HL1]|nr:DNA polymerase [Pseudomonas sp. TCU-HL1]